ncbi:hypothetical protein OQ471_04990 [Bacillus sp. KeR2]|uniref:hypothetical protein n=1 Tax=Bacillus sp. KeR2 TaxID=2994533 RepID=UPI00224A650C|nr:hypothetical protein [Bacillus sp. KeR2]MCX2851358.1 hypothetical protein [Bacillus sp. KeR2]
MLKKQVLSYYKNLMINVLKQYELEEARTIINGFKSNLIGFSELDQEITYQDYEELIKEVELSTGLMVSEKGIISELEQFHKDAEFWYYHAELDVLEGSYFPVDPTKKRVPSYARKRNRIVKQKNFKDLVHTLNSLDQNLLKMFKEYGSQLNSFERKKVMIWRKDIKKMTNQSESYIRILAN